MGAGQRHPLAMGARHTGEVPPGPEYNRDAEPEPKLGPEPESDFHLMSAERNKCHSSTNRSINQPINQPTNQ